MSQSVGRTVVPSVTIVRSVRQSAGQSQSVSQSFVSQSDGRPIGESRQHGVTAGTDRRRSGPAADRAPPLHRTLCIHYTVYTATATARCVLGLRNAECTPTTNALLRGSVLRIPHTPQTRIPPEHSTPHGPMHTRTWPLEECTFGHTTEEYILEQVTNTSNNSKQATEGYTTEQTTEHSFTEHRHQGTWRHNPQ